MSVRALLGAAALGAAAWWMARDRSDLMREAVLMPGKVKRFLGDPLPFEKGKHYRLRFTELLLSKGDVVHLLDGFDRLVFYPSAMLLPPDWPKELATQDDPNTRFAEGTWIADSMRVEKPQGVYQVWES